MVTSTINIKAPASKIWQALTDKAQMKEWYFDIPDFELEVGKTFNFYEPGDAREFHHRCVIKEIEINSKFSHTWTHPDYSKGESVVTWILEDQGDGVTKVILQHQGIENFADAGPEFAPENYQLGWDGFMAILKNYLNGIRKHSYKIEINAPTEKVWNVLFDDETYRLWTAVFCEGSYYTGKLEQGARVHFLSPDGSGMYSNIVFCNPYKTMLYQHIGEVKDFKEQPIDEATELWTGAFEDYNLKEKDGKTVLTAEIDLTLDHVASFEKAFSKGLKKVKELSETI